MMYTEAIQIREIGCFQYRNNLSLLVSKINGSHVKSYVPRKREKDIMVLE